MDLPLKLEIPRLSHADVLKILLPFAPGLVLALNAAFTGFRPLVLAAAWGLGYKAALVCYAVFIYLAGVASTQVVDITSTTLALRLRPARSMPLYTEPYWRRLVSEYIGSDRSPESIALSDEAASDHVNRIAQRDAGARDARNNVQLQSQETTRILEEKQKEANLMLDGADKTRLLDSLDSIRARKNDLERDWILRTHNTVKEHAWLQVSAAMPLVEEVDDPYAGFDGLMTALQTSAVIQLAFCSSVSRERNLAVIACAGLLLAVTTFQRFEIYRLSKIYRELNVKPIASMLKSLSASDTKGRE